jgi:hypothetical protein
MATGSAFVVVVRVATPKSEIRNPKSTIRVTSKQKEEAPK